MSYLRRTPQELQTFNKVVKEYKADGYPTWYAEQCAWDIIHTERKVRGFKPRRKVAA